MLLLITLALAPLITLALAPLIAADHTNKHTSHPPSINDHHPSNNDHPPSNNDEDGEDYTPSDYKLALSP